MPEPQTWENQSLELVLDPTDSDSIDVYKCITCFSHCCEKIIRSCEKKEEIWGRKGLCWLAVQENTVHYDGEIMAAGAQISWSHSISTQLTDGKWEMVWAIKHVAVVCLWNVLHRLMSLNTWCPADADADADVDADVDAACLSNLLEI